MNKISHEQLVALQQAVVLLSDPKTHIQGTMAEDENGLQVSPNSERAVQFCALGAFQRTGVTDGTVAVFAAHVKKNSSLRLALEGLKSKFDAEEIVYTVNDHEPAGRGAIRRLMKSFVRKQLELRHGDGVG